MADVALIFGAKSALENTPYWPPSGNDNYGWYKLFSSSE